MTDQERTQEITKAAARVFYWMTRTAEAMEQGREMFSAYNIGSAYACDLEKEKARAGWEFCESADWAQIMKNARKMASDERKQEIKRGEY